MANEVRVQKRVVLVLWAEDGVVYISPIQSDFAREGVDVDEGIVEGGTHDDDAAGGLRSVIEVGENVEGLDAIFRSDAYMVIPV